MTLLTPLLHEKVILVTGATDGIGKMTAMGLASLGATVVVVGRDALKGQSTVEAIRATTGNPAVALLLADLSSQTAIRHLAEEVLARYDRLDVLVNNVGGLYAQRWETVDGVEATFAMNVLAPFLLTHLLLPLLQASAPARIVNVNSSMHRSATLDINDLQAYHWYRGLDIYGRAKLANLLWTYALARQLAGTGITVNAVDPGTAPTTMSLGLTPAMVPWYLRLALPFVRRIQATQTIEHAARSSIYAASSPAVEGVSGRFFNPKAQARPSSKLSYNAMLAQQVWRASAELTGVADRQYWDMCRSSL